MADDEDPIIASYDIVLTSPPQAAEHEASDDVPTATSRLLVLQYPAHRPSSRPYAASRHQKPTSLRFKKNTGILEVDVPLVTNEYYNHDAGSKYGSAISESRTLRVGGSHGLAGGFNTGPTQVGSLHDIPEHQAADVVRPALASQTLGGKIAKQSEREPIYFLGSLRDNALHLSHLDAVVQMRPQLHHIDAEDENSQRRIQMNGAAGTKKPGLEVAPKMESKAIEIKLKDSKEDPRDRSLNASSKLLRDIQMDQWQRHEWIDQDNNDAQEQAAAYLYADNSNGHVQLKSALSNGDWLDRMSAPREDGKKGLLAKLRGRERERARRKKAEEEKKQKSKDTSTPADLTKGPLLEQSSDSDLSSPEASDLDQDEPEEVPVQSAPAEAIEIKEEPDPVSPPAARKRGRPKKVPQSDGVAGS
jgi:hypothetical protein